MHVCIIDCQSGVLGVAPVHNAVLVYTCLGASVCGHRLWQKPALQLGRWVVSWRVI
jgi:hypothetical protein